MDEIIYFELNNWMPRDDYPDAEPFETWCGNDETLYFTSRRWCKENNLVVTIGLVDQSFNFCIGATKEWVEKNCPELLTKYTEFLRQDKKSRFGQPFKDYTTENIGLYICELNYNTGEWEFLTDEDFKNSTWFEDRDKEIYGDT